MSIYADRGARVRSPGKTTSTSMARFHHYKIFLTCVGTLAWLRGIEHLLGSAFNMAFVGSAVDCLST